MRLSLLSVMIVAGMLMAPVPQKAAAAPVTTAAARIIPTVAGSSNLLLPRPLLPVLLSRWLLPLPLRGTLLSARLLSLWPLALLLTDRAILTNRNARTLERVAACRDAPCVRLTPHVARGGIS